MGKIPFKPQTEAGVTFELGLKGVMSFVLLQDKSIFDSKILCSSYTGVFKRYHLALLTKEAYIAMFLTILSNFREKYNKIKC